MPVRLSKIFVIVVAVLFGAFLIFQPIYNANAALVPCGRAGQPICTTCDIFVLASNIINFVLFTLVPAIAVLLYLIAGFLILLGGANPGWVSTGRTIFKNTTWGLIIIFTSWMITNTVLKSLAGDPQFTDNWYKVTCTEPIGGGPVQPPPPAKGQLPITISEDLKKLSQQILTSNVRLSTSGDCGSNFTAKRNIEDMAAGKLATVCSSTCNCQPGGSSGDIYLNPSILEGLLALSEWMKQQGVSGGFTITSLMTGKHSVNSAHYTGQAVDIVPESTNRADWSRIRSFLNGYGGIAICEGSNNRDVANCSGVNHIHWTLRFGN